MGVLQTDAGRLERHMAAGAMCVWWGKKAQLDRQHVSCCLWHLKIRTLFTRLCRVVL